ncbi:MAG: hypothetical protein IMW98_01435 [Firmicutes bacterium]|nr:hypothetical protein [Bacillota bacterium]
MRAAQQSYETGCRLERQGLYGAAVSEWRRTVKLARQEGDWATEHRAYNALATGYMALDRNCRAQRIAERALRLSTARPLTLSTLWSAWNLFISSYRLSDPERFRRSAHTFAEIYDALQQPEEAAGEAAYVRAVLAYESEDFDTAADLFELAGEAWTHMPVDRLVAEELQGMSDVLGGRPERGAERLLEVYERARDVFPIRYLVKTASDTAAALTICGDPASAVGYAAQSLEGLIACPGSLDPPEVGRLAAVAAAYGGARGESADDLRAYARAWLGALGCGTDARHLLHLRVDGQGCAAGALDLPALRSTARLVQHDLASHRCGFHLAYYCEHIAGRVLTLAPSLIRDLSYAAYLGRLELLELSLPYGPAARDLAVVVRTGKAGETPEAQLAWMLDVYERTLTRAGYEKALNDLIRARNREVDAELVDRFIDLHFAEEASVLTAGKEVNP